VVPHFVFLVSWVCACVRVVCGVCVAGGVALPRPPPCRSVGVCIPPLVCVSVEGWTDKRMKHPTKGTRRYFVVVCCAIDGICLLYYILLYSKGCAISTFVIVGYLS
jgi:hypothetical protein